MVICKCLDIVNTSIVIPTIQIDFGVTSLSALPTSLSITLIVLTRVNFSSCRWAPRGEPRLELGVHRLWNYVELFWNSLDNVPSSIVFYVEMKVEVGVHNIRSRFTPR